jgi:hypothetical protein
MYDKNSIVIARGGFHIKECVCIIWNAVCLHLLSAFCTQGSQIGKPTRARSILRPGVS